MKMLFSVIVSSLLVWFASRFELNVIDDTVE